MTPGAAKSLTRSAAPLPFGRPLYFNRALSDLARLLSPVDAADDCSSELMFEGVSHRAMRQILDRYGFDLPPIDVGELYGLLDYCDRLDAMTGNGVFSAQQILQWKLLSEGLNRNAVSPGHRAIRLYAMGDLNGLRRLHRRQNTLARLGRAYRDVAESMSHLTTPSWRGPSDSQLTSDER